MKIIDRYATIALVKPFLFCLTTFFFLWIIFDLFDNIGDFTNSESGLWLIIKLYWVQLPGIAQIILPVSFFFACLYVLTNFSRNQELIASQSGGVSLARVSLPFFILAFLVSGIQLFLFFNLSPEAKSKKDGLEEIIKGKDKEKHIFRKTVYKNPKTQTMWYIYKIDTRENLLEHADIFIPDELNRDKLKIVAAQGRYRNGFWDLAGVRVMKFEPDGNVTFEDHMQLDADFLTESPAQITAALLEPEEMNWKSLYQFITSEFKTSNQQMARYITDHHYRMAYPFLSPILCLFAFALGITHSRRSQAASIFNCILVLFVLLIWIKLSVAFGNGGRISPFLAGWNTVFVFGSVGFLLFSLKVGWIWEFLGYWDNKESQEN